MIENPVHLWRSSDCSTVPLRDGRDDRGVDGGYLKGGLAISLADKTYTKARIAVTVNEIPAGFDPAIDFRICAWDLEAKELRATTDNLASKINALPRGQVAQDLGGSVVIADFLEPLSLYEGERVVLGTATHGTYKLRNLSLASKGLRKVLTAWTPQLSFRAIPNAEWAEPDGAPSGGYAGGTPGPIGDEPAGNYPWVELT